MQRQAMAHLALWLWHWGRLWGWRGHPRRGGDLQWVEGCERLLLSSNFSGGLGWSPAAASPRNSILGHAGALMPGPDHKWRSGEHRGGALRASSIDASLACKSRVAFTLDVSEQGLPNQAEGRCRRHVGRINVHEFDSREVETHGCARDRRRNHGQRRLVCRSLDRRRGSCCRLRLRRDHSWARPTSLHLVAASACSGHRSSLAGPAIGLTSLGTRACRAARVQLCQRLGRTARKFVLDEPMPLAVSDMAYGVDPEEVASRRSVMLRMRLPQLL